MKKEYRNGEVFYILSENEKKELDKLIFNSKDEEKV